MRRVLKVLAALVLAFVLVVGGLLGMTFAGNPPIDDGAEIAGVARVVKDGYVAAFVLDVGGGKVALVDAGNDADAKALLAELSRRGLGPADVTDILITHGHRDHISGVPRFPGARVHALAPEVPLVEGRVGSSGPATQLFPAEDLGVRVSHPAQDGAIVPIGNRTAEVFAVPGHTAGSAAWLVGGVLFLGDSADATKEGRMAPAKWLFSDDAAQNEASLRELAERLAPRRADIEALAFAHTGVLAGNEALFAFR